MTDIDIARGVLVDIVDVLLSSQCTSEQHNGIDCRVAIPVRNAVVWAYWRGCARRCCSRRSRSCSGSCELMSTHNAESMIPERLKLNEAVW